MFTGQPQGASQIAQGATLYLFNRKDFTVAMASVLNVSQPHVSKAAQTNPALGMQGFVVDLTLSMGNETTSVEYPVNSQGANYPEKGWYISPDQAAVSREIEAANNTDPELVCQGKERLKALLRFYRRSGDQDMLIKQERFKHGIHR